MSTNSDRNGSDAGFVLDKPGEIVEKLRLMAKLHCLVSVQIGPRGPSLGAMIDRVLPEKGLVVVDPSVNGERNRQLLAAGRARCETQVNGIEAGFDLHGLREATLDGRQLFVAAIPETLFWLQRRAYYRVTIPIGRSVRCQAHLLGEGQLEFAVHNLSLVGMALLDGSGLLRQWGRAGQILKPCRLLVAGLDDEDFALELRNKIEPLRREDLLSATRVGLAFRGIGRGFEIKLQKYIFELEREFRREQDGAGS